MYIIFTAASLVILGACVLVHHHTVRWADKAVQAMQRAEKAHVGLLTERTRIMSTERELATLTREVRKLSGKFYASQREEAANDNPPPTITAHELVSSAPYCEKYEIAQKEGPTSKAAQCDCNYCRGRRLSKEQFRERQRAAGHLNPTWVRDHSTGSGNHGE